MNIQVQLNFYDEKIIIPLPATFEELKLYIAQQFFLEMADVNELVMYFILDDRRVNIKDQNTFKAAIDKNISLNIFLEVSEQSQLYQRELLNSKVVVPVEEEKPKVDNSINEERARIYREIQEKEKQLKDILEKEAAEKERKLQEDRAKKEREELLRKEEEARRIKDEEEMIRRKAEEEARKELEKKAREQMLQELKEQEEKLKRQLQASMEKKRAEELKKQEELRLVELEAMENLKKLQEQAQKQSVVVEEEKPKQLTEDLKEDIRKSVCDLINKNLEKVKGQLCEQTVNQAFKIIDSKVSLNQSQVTTVHNGFTCDGCGMNPIIGVRYRCHTCPNFDFCETCEQFRGEEHAHPMIKYRNECNWKTFEGGKCFWKNKGNFFNKIKKLFHEKEEPIVCNKPEEKEVPKESPQGGQYAQQAQEIASSFELPGISVKDIENALEKTKGIFEEAIEILYKNFS
jgi:chemotaxis protein histidine kinase CheA